MKGSSELGESVLKHFHAPPPVGFHDGVPPTEDVSGSSRASMTLSLLASNAWVTPEVLFQSIRQPAISVHEVRLCIRKYSTLMSWCQAARIWSRCSWTKKGVVEKWLVFGVLDHRSHAVVLGPPSMSPRCRGTGLRRASNSFT